MEKIPGVEAPALFIVGSNDTPVIELNQKAFQKLNCEGELQIVPGAAHLFDEPGKMDMVADAAVEWYNEHLK
jgi:putative phosphoribosyl transferase